MARTSLALISAMPSVLNLTGEPVAGVGWRGHTRGLMTFAITVHNFQGRIALQGSQARVPGATDWFALPCPPPYDSLPYIQYPRAVALPRYLFSLYPYYYPNPNLRGSENSTIGFSLASNCLWLRAVISRDYLMPVGLPLYGSACVADAISWLGVVDTILVNY